MAATICWTVTQNRLKRSGDEMAATICWTVTQNRLKRSGDEIAELVKTDSYR